MSPHASSMASTIRNAVIGGAVGALFMLWLAGKLDAAPNSRFHLMSKDTIDRYIDVGVVRDRWTNKCYGFVHVGNGGAGLGEVTCGDMK